MEVKLEERLIEKLRELKYTCRPDIRDRDALELNFRNKFDALNRVRLTDSEFNRLLEDIVTPDVFAASRRLREVNSFECDDGIPLNYTLINIKNWSRNDYEAVNMLRINPDSGRRHYGAILLVNGVPVVQIELKALETSPRRAMQQIVDCKNDPDNGYSSTLLCFMQIFVVGSQSRTFYFANNNNSHFSFDADERFLPAYRFADENNVKIENPDMFAEKFLAKSILGEMIHRYMVLVASEQKLLMMRPYQIYAVKAIVDCIEQNRGNGYVWHTAGSGKTLTSFKASTLLKDNPDIEKCLFVVDSKDLDRQTREELNRFQEGCTEQNTNAETLVGRMLSDDCADKVIVTTIQKLGVALDPSHGEDYNKRLQPLSGKRIVFIFDDCHRSRFGDNYKAIKEFFPNAQLFGFTGTPIFNDNAACTKIDGQQASCQTTGDIFQKQLHAYTIAQAIRDGNVLRFHIDYFKPEGNHKPETGEPLAKQVVADYILNKHDAATGARRFNAIFAAASINDAIDYYELFKAMQERRQAADENFRPLNIACVFSPPADGNKALETIIADYNERYGVDYSVAEFDSYYQDVQRRINDHKYSSADYPRAGKIDVTIVADMLLAGFDSKYLNTLYVDKNLKHHELIQAFSRTNRVLNDTKPCGNILDFRGQQSEADAAFVLFSGEDLPERAKDIWLADPAPKMVKKFEKAAEDLGKFMQLHGLACMPEEVRNLEGDAARAEFINRFKEVQRCKIQLDQYTDLRGEDCAAIEKLLPDDRLQAFCGAYLDTAKRLKAQRDKKGEETDPEVQRLDFEFVLFASATVDYDYITSLIAKYTRLEPAKRKMILEQLITLLDASANLMDERDEIVEYIHTLEAGGGLSEKEIREGYQRFKNEKFAMALTAAARKHGLEAASLHAFAENIMNRMIFDGELLRDLLVPLKLGWKARVGKEMALMEDLIPLLKKLAEGREISGLSAYEK
jgi:type I restriction enzyme R subunit